MGPSSAARAAVTAAVLLASALSVHVATAAGRPAGPALAPADATATPSASPDPSPAPSPTASATATPSPVPGPSGSPSPSASPNPTPNPSPSASASATPLPSATPSPSATPTPPSIGRQALPPPAPSVAVLGADTIQLNSLRSIAVKTVATSGGPTRVIELVADGSTLTGLNLQAPCTGRSRVTTTATQERMTGGVTLDATALQATILGVPIVVAAADLPEGQLTLPGVSLPTLPADLGLLTVRLFALTIQSGAMNLSGAQLTTAAC